ncbi:aminopeptidase [Haloferax sp. DFSO60]|uniref:aminopeptidase n=1 Tax=Haloferax sp. DFSO60 TaxID=3388652 RepID=UPI003978D5A3
MDPRIREHAQTIVDHSTQVEAGDKVVVAAPPVADDLVTALNELLGERGAYVVNTNNNPRFMRAYLRNSEQDEFETPEHLLALFEEADVLIRVRAETNATEQSDISPETNAAWKRAYKPVQAEALSKRWCLTQYPAPGSAQLASMSTEAYENFVYDAVSLDWEAQEALQAEMVEILNDADEVRIKSGDETDVTMSIEGNTAINDKGMHNLPGGEVFTAPVKDSVEGEVYFDLPLYRQGREVSGVRVTFEDGEVVDYSAEGNEEVLDGVFNTDDGARFLGELGIGMNRSIDRFTYNMLFDEKMGDTVHMAVGAAYPETVGDENEVNESAEHVDMIVDMSEDSVIEVDGEVVQRNGTFVFEDDF